MNSIAQGVLASLLTAGVLVGATAAYVHMEKPEIKISAPVVYQQPPEIVIPPMEAPKIDNEALAEAIVNKMNAASEKKETNLRAAAEADWCRRMPELASCK